MSKKKLKAWDANFRATSRVATRRQRNLIAVAGLTVSTVLLMVLGLGVDLWFVPTLATVACYAPATLSGVVLLLFLFNKRLWVTQRPTS